jgi:hypothetical protein
VSATVARAFEIRATGLPSYESRHRGVGPRLQSLHEKKDPLMIKKISEQELVLESKKGVTFEFKRMK